MQIKELTWINDAAQTIDGIYIIHTHVGVYYLKFRELYWNHDEYIFIDSFQNKNAAKEYAQKLHEYSITNLIDKFCENI